MAGRFQKGNTASVGHGRPPGSGFTAELRRVVGKAEFTALVQTIYDRAMSGDMQAAQVLVQRLVPPLKPKSEAISIRLDAETMSAKASQVLDAVATGRISPDDASTLLASLANLSRILETDDLVKRVEALEQAQHDKQS